jgi:hypothetical protein
MSCRVTLHGLNPVIIIRSCATPGFCFRSLLLVARTSVPSVVCSIAGTVTFLSDSNVTGVSGTARVFCKRGWLVPSTVGLLSSRLTLRLFAMQVAIRGCDFDRRLPSQCTRCACCCWSWVADHQPRVHDPSWCSERALHSRIQPSRYAWVGWSVPACSRFQRFWVCQGQNLMLRGVDHILSEA